jgi:hypothetical protein
MLSLNPNKKCLTPKEFLGQKLLHTVLKVKHPISGHFFVDNFFLLFSRIQNKYQILRF